MGDSVFLSARFERFAATDFVVVEAEGLWAATSEAPTEAGIDDVLHFQSLNLNYNYLFFLTEVSESIWLSPACVGISFDEGALKVDTEDGIFGLGTLYILTIFFASG